MTQPICAQKSPIAVKVEAGKKYFWCACGRSTTQPFCDGAHKGTGLAPLQYEAEKAQEVWFCACKATKNSPFCDGSHKAL